MKYWTGNLIKFNQIRGTNNIFVFGSNPEGRHGMGAAKAAMLMGAKYGIGRGLVGNTYALITKNISKSVPYTESNGTVYNRTGKLSVTKEQLTTNWKEFVVCARENPNKNFIIAFQNTKATLSGVLPRELISILLELKLPDNIYIHESFKGVYNG